MGHHTAPTIVGCVVLIEKEHTAMPIATQEKAISLARDATIVLDHAYGTTVYCRQGSVWLTQYGDCRDIVLGDGDRFQIDRSQVIVIAAMRASELSILPTAAPALLAKGWRALPGRLLHLIFGHRWRAAANAHMWMHNLPG
jgi:hypothetical protein